MKKFQGRHNKGIFISIYCNNYVSGLPAVAQYTEMGAACISVDWVSNHVSGGKIG